MFEGPGSRRELNKSIYIFSSWIINDSEVVKYISVKIDDVLAACIIINVVTMMIDAVKTAVSNLEITASRLRGSCRSKPHVYKGSPTVSGGILYPLIGEYWWVMLRAGMVQCAIITNSNA